MILAANSFLNYRALTRQTTAAQPRTTPRLAAASFTNAAAGFTNVVRQVPDLPDFNPEPHTRPHHDDHDDLHSLKRGLLINTTLALVLVFAVAAAAGGPRQRS